MSALPPSTYALAVHKSHVERVSNWLIDQPSFLDDTTKKTSHEASIKLQAQPEKKAFFRTLLATTKRSPYRLPALARQNISWISAMSHYADQWNGDLGQCWWNLLVGQGFSVAQHFLRVDAHPPALGDRVCLAIEQAYARSQGKEPPTSPFLADGDIEFTKSHTKSTHRLTVVEIDGRLYFGIENRQQHHDAFHVGLNHMAGEEIPMAAADNTTGKDVAAVSVDVPLSRAYYKLDQVFRDHLNAQNERLCIGAGAGLDLGASPGGWTQVLLKSGVAAVVAVDAGLLADRIAKNSSVIYLRSSMQTAKLSDYGPYSIAVCDASILWTDLFELFVNNDLLKTTQWLLPMTWVITLKFPFKRATSIQRQLDLISERVPKFVADLAELLYPRRRVQSTYSVDHLFANSESERTLLIVFEEKPR